MKPLYTFYVQATDQIIDLSLLGKSNIATAAIKTPQVPAAPSLEPVYTTDEYVNGLAEANSTIVITINEKVYMDVIDESGQFSVPIERQPVGSLVEAYIKDSLGYTSTKAGVYVRKIPDVPIVDSVYTYDTVVTGSGEANMTITLIIENRNYIGRVTATLEMPSEEFDGIILGGLHFEKENVDVEESEGINIENHYAYVVGVQLRENNQTVDPELSLHSVFPDMYHYRPVIKALLQNSAATIINDLKIRSLIYQQGETMPLKEIVQTVNMAPNSTMNVVIDWENSPLEPGEYLLEFYAEHGDDFWEWEENFVIEKEEAEQINSAAVGLEDNNNQTEVSLKIGIAILILIIISLVAYIGKLKHPKNFNRKGRFV